ncbi:MAG: hypothetical protein AAFP26_05625 [Planctomycetota bacterium]
MPNTAHPARFTTLTALCTTAMLLSLSGCDQTQTTNPPPRGDTGGRVDPYRSTGIDAGSARASTVDLLEFSDRVGEALASRIATIPEIAGAADRVVIEMGAIENSTQTPSSDFAIMRRRVFASLVNSDLVRPYADILEAPEVTDRQRGRFAIDPGSTDRYDTRATYVLQGFFGELSRGGGIQSNYYYEMTLTNLQSRRILFVEQFDSKQIR